MIIFILLDCQFGSCERQFSVITESVMLPISSNRKFFIKCSNIENILIVIRNCWSRISNMSQTNCTKYGDLTDHVLILHLCRYFYESRAICVQALWMETWLVVKGHASGCKIPSTCLLDIPVSWCKNKNDSLTQQIAPQNTISSVLAIT